MEVSIWIIVAYGAACGIGGFAGATWAILKDAKKQGIKLKL